MRLLLHFLLSSLAVFIAARLLPGASVDSFTTAMKAALVLGLGALVLGKLIGREFALGQVNLLILGLILTSLLFYQNGRDGRAGLFWALSLFFKPYALVFLPYFILK